MKRFTFLSAAVTAMGAMVLVTGASITWSQSTSTRPSGGGEGSGSASAGPATQQSDARPRRFGPGGDAMRQRWAEWRRSGGGPGVLGEPRPENFAEPTAEEWKDIEAFMKIHSPKRLEHLDDIGDDRQQNVKNMFAARYRALNELKDQDPEMYQIRLARMPIEDKVFELGWKLAHNRGVKDFKPDDTRAELRTQLRELIKSRFQERALRLKHLEKRLANERQKLKDDEQRLDDLVNANLSDLAEEKIPRDLRPQLMPRRPRPPEDSGDVNAAPPPPPPSADQ